MLVENFTKVEGIDEKVARYAKFHGIDAEDVAVDGVVTEAFADRIAIEDGKLFDIVADANETEVRTVVSYEVPEGMVQITQEEYDELVAQAGTVTDEVIEEEEEAIED